MRSSKVKLPSVAPPEMYQKQRGDQPQQRNLAVVTNPVPKPNAENHVLAESTNDLLRIPAFQNRLGVVIDHFRLAARHFVKRRSEDLFSGLEKALPDLFLHAGIA